MTWHAFGPAALAAIKAAIPAVGGHALLTEVTTGEPAYECGDTIVAAWINSVNPVVGEIKCTFTPEVSWTLRLHHCTDPNAPGDQAEIWHGLLMNVYCALTTFLSTWCNDMACNVRFDRITVNPPSGLQIVADLVVTLEESCPND